MTFDEAYAYADEYTHTVGDYDEPAIGPIEVEEIINGLKDTYAPTIEMTKNQYLFITSEYEKESVVDAVANLTADNIIKEEFHSNFWSPLSENQVVQAWLHPETIKVKN